jgi:hypothetical protein
LALSKSSVLYGETGRRCSGLINQKFRLKMTMQVLYGKLYMRANFQAGYYIAGVGRKVQSLRFLAILYVKKCARGGTVQEVAQASTNRASSTI